MLILVIYKLTYKLIYIKSSSNYKIQNVALSFKKNPLKCYSDSKYSAFMYFISGKSIVARFLIGNQDPKNHPLNYRKLGLGYVFFY